LSAAADSGGPGPDSLIADLHRAAAEKAGGDPATAAQIDGFVRDCDAALRASLATLLGGTSFVMSDAQLDAAESAFAVGLAAMRATARAALGAPDR